MLRYRTNDRTVTAVIPAGPKTGPCTRQSEKEKNQNRNQASKADILPHRALPCPGCCRTRRVWRLWGQIRTFGESCPAVTAESCIIGISKATIWTSHVVSVCCFQSIPENGFPAMSPEQSLIVRIPSA